jgi:predicted CopG family antitoxin
MHKKMTITIDEEVYDALYRVVGKGNISQFLESLARPHVLKEDLASAYQAMAADTEREREALEWSNGLIGSAIDVAG